MVRELTLELDIPGYTPVGLHKAVFRNDKLLRRYHAEVNNDPNIQIGEWKDGKREVLFKMEVALPATLRKVIGEGDIPVKQIQEVVWDGDESYSIMSDPQIEIAVASAFSTKSVFKVTPLPGSKGSHIAAAVTCTASSAPWVLQSTIESIMAAEAKKRIGGFMEFIKAFCERLQAGLEQLDEGEEAALAEAAEAVPAVTTEALPIEAPSALPAVAAPAAAAVNATVGVPAAVAVTTTRAVAVGPVAAAAMPAALGPLDIFYDAQEDTPGARVLHELVEQMKATNRHLELVTKSVQHIDIELTRAMAYQEGLLAGQRMVAHSSSSSIFYLAALTGAAFAAGAAAMLMRAKVTNSR